MTGNTVETTASNAPAILPLFRSHYSIALSALTLQEPGKAKPGAPISIWDLAKEADLKQVVVCDTRIDGFVEAYKMAAKLGIQLIYGIKLVVCADVADRDLSSRRGESKVIVLIRNTAGYSDLLRIWSRAWGPEGHVRFRIAGDDIAYGRTDWRTLKAFWTPNLSLALPFTSSFLARNVLTFGAIVPDLPTVPWVLREVGSGLPQAGLIDRAIDRYVAQEPAAQVVPCKTIAYRSAADMRAYVVLRCIGEGTSYEEGADGVSSDTFSFESWRELNAAATQAVQPVLASP